MTRQNKVLVVGYGAVALGFLGPLLRENLLEPIFCLSEKTYKKWFEKSNPPLEYKIHKVNLNTESISTEDFHDIKAIPCYNGRNPSDKILNYADEIQLLITAVGASNLLSTSNFQNLLPISSLLERIIMKRKNSGIDQKLNIILVENISISGEEVGKLEHKIICNLPQEYKEYVKDNIGIVDSLIEITCVIPDKNNLEIIVDQCDNRFYINKNQIKGNLPFPNLDNIVLENDIKAKRVKKLLVHNNADTMTAYLGARYGYEYIREAIADRRVYSIVYQALREIKQGLLQKYSDREDFTLDNLEKYINNQIKRIKCPFMKDTVDRIARDPRRKLGKDERFLGAVQLAVEMEIPPINILECSKAAAEYWEKLKVKTKTENKVKENIAVCSVI